MYYVMCGGSLVSPVHSFYGKPNEDHLWHRFIEIAKREGRNASIILWDFIVKYVEEHGPGNPQSRIESFVEGGLTDQGAIEGRIRQKFSQGKEVSYQDILKQCKAEVPNIKSAIAMAERISKWLNNRGVRIWR